MSQESIEFVKELTLISYHLGLSIQSYSNVYAMNVVTALKDHQDNINKLIKRWKEID